MTITAVNLAPNKPTVSAAPANITEGNSYTVTASGGSDQDGGTVTYGNWSVSGSSGAPSATISSGACPGSTTANSACLAIPASSHNHTYTVTVDARDNDNTSTTSDGVAFRVNNRPPPTPSAGADQTVNQKSTVTLQRNSVTDADGDTVTYSWALTSTTFSPDPRRSPPPPTRRTQRRRPSPPRT